MKRYLVFSGPNYYPGGGFKDFDDAFDGLPEAVERAKERWAHWGPEYAWAHVVDLESGTIAWEAPCP